MRVPPQYATHGLYDPEDGEWCDRFYASQEEAQRGVNQEYARDNVDANGVDDTGWVVKSTTGNETIKPTKR